MRKDKKLGISFGKLGSEAPSWDLGFWQSANSDERFQATCELVKITYSVKHGNAPAEPVLPS